MKAAIDLVVSLYKILNSNTPDISVIVLLYDALERIKKYLDTDGEGSSPSSSKNLQVLSTQAPRWGAIQVPRMRRGESRLKKRMEKAETSADSETNTLEIDVGEIDVVEGLRIAWKEIHKKIENKTRWRILNRLTEKESLTWTEMQKDMGINSNLIKHHTVYLLELGLIEKINPGFRITNAGRAIMTLSLEQMLRLAKIGIERYDSSKKERRIPHGNPGDKNKHSEVLTVGGERGGK